MGDDALAKALAENVRRSRAMTEGMQSGQYGAKPSAITDTSHLDDTDEDT